MEPSIKGSLIRVAVDQIRELIASGKAREDDLRAALGPEWSEAVLDRDIGTATWYPARLYDAILRFMMATGGGGRPEYLIESGRQSAALLAQKGVYLQMQRKADGRAHASLLRLTITLAKSLLSFTTWELAKLDVDEGYYEIHITDAAEYPDTFLYRNIGFVETMTCEATGERWRVRGERPTRDRVVLTVRRVPPGRPS